MTYNDVKSERLTTTKLTPPIERVRKPTSPYSSRINLAEFVAQNETCKKTDYTFKAAEKRRDQEAQKLEKQKKHEAQKLEKQRKTENFEKMKNAESFKPLDVFDIKSLRKVIDELEEEDGIREEKTETAKDSPSKNESEEKTETPPSFEELMASLEDLGN